MIKIRIYILFIVSLFLTANLFAENVKVSGKVVDNEDKPVEFATIRVAGTAIGTNSDLKGQYSLSVAQKDTIELVYSCIGFKTVTHKLVNPKGDLTLNVRMYPNDVELKELEVLGFRNSVNGMQSFDTESFKLSPDVSGGSVEAMISTMPGVNSSNELSSQYSVRGGSFDENSVYINGTEIYRPQLVRAGQQEGLSIINPDMVGSLKFSSGGFPARYDDKMSSALDITYREPEAFEGAVSASLMGASVTIGQNSGKFSQLHGLRFKKNNSLLSSMDTKGEYDPTYFDYQTNLNLKPNDRWTVNFLGNISLNHYNFTPSSRETTFGTAQDVKHFKVYFDGQEKDKFETFLGSLSVQYRHNRATSFMLGASGFLTNELVSYDISGEYWLDQAGTSGSEGVGGELGVGKYMEHSRNRLKASVFRLFLKGQTRIKGNHISYGVDYRRENFRDRTKEWEWRDSAGYSLPTLPDGVHLIYNLSSNHNLSTNRLSAYAEDAYYIDTDKAYMTLNGGVRFSYWDFNKEFLFSPRISVSYIPAKADRWVFRFATGLYYQSPFYKEFRRPVENGTVIELNNEIKSQRSWQFILGADYTFRMLNRPFKLSGEAYYKALSNLIPYEVDNLKIVYDGINSSSGFAAGVDFKLFGQFVPGSDSWISFSLMKTQETLNGVKVPRPNDRRYSFAMYFTDYFPKFPRLKLNLRGVFSDGLPTTAPHSSRDKGYFRTPAYKRVDIGLSYALLPSLKEGETRGGIYRFLKSVWLGVDCFNLFDISNVSSYYWVTDVNDVQYAVPNYLTRRQINVSLTIDF